MSKTILIQEETANDLSILLDNLLLNSFEFDFPSETMEKIANIKAEIDSQLDISFTRDKDK